MSSAETTPPPRQIGSSPWRRWLLQQGDSKSHAKSPWYKVMCLTGVDYFSTLGYQPGIALAAAAAVGAGGWALSPLATLLLVLVTLFGALPVYAYVAGVSPHGQGSIFMLERLLSRWTGKALVLVLLGFTATDFIITITLSASDAAAHVVENPFVPETFRHPVLITLGLIGLLCAVFLKGFREAIGLAVVLVVLYLVLNAIVIVVAGQALLAQPEKIAAWQQALMEPASGGGFGLALFASVLLFPKLALGMSGFETGVSIMPQVQGDFFDTEKFPDGRIRNTRWLLLVCALIMSAYLISSSLVTTLLVPAQLVVEGGEAEGRALAYLAHLYLGEGFGTLYDISTVLILWFAGASAMAGLINVVPRYLPRYGMAPVWAQATRPQVLIYTAIAVVITLIFQADVAAQAGAYATGVLVLMVSAAFAVALHNKDIPERRVYFSLVTAIFLYILADNIIERTDGLVIAGCFIGFIVLASLCSRVLRSTELRIHTVNMDAGAEDILRQQALTGHLRFIANHLDVGDLKEYSEKERDIKIENHIGTDAPVVFFEVHVGDASEFEGSINIQGRHVGPYAVLRCRSGAVPNAIAAFMLHAQKTTRLMPHIYFEWSEGNPLKFLLRYIFFGEGDVPVVTREVLRRAQPNPDLRPSIHIAG